MNPLGTPGGVVSPRNERAFDLLREARQAKDADSPRFFKAAVLKTYFTPCADISGPGGAGAKETKPTIRQLEAIFEVPRSTVGKWIAHHRHQADLFARSTLDQAVDLVQDDAISGDRSVFLRSEELKIVNYLFVRSAFAHVALTKPNTIELFMRLSQVPRPDGKPRRQFGPNGPSESFLERFFAEFSDELRWITAHSIETIRTAAMNEETLRSFFERLQELCDKSGGKLWAEPGRIFSCIPSLLTFEELLRAPPLTPSLSCTEPATVRTVKPNKAYSPQDAAQRATQHEREAREQEKAQVAPLMEEYKRAMRTYEDKIEPFMNQQDQLKSTIAADQTRLAELEADDSAAALVADVRAQLHANQQRLAKVNATVKQMVAAKPKRPDVRHVRALAASKAAAAAPALQSVATMAVEQDDSDDECEEDGIPPSPMQVTSAAPARSRKRIYERDSDDEAAPSFETAQSGGSDENVTYSLSSRSLERLKEPRLATRSSSRLILPPGMTLSRANTSGVSSWLTNDMAAMQLVSTDENVSSTPKTDRRKRLALSDLSNSN
ncbi:hypothetical protein CAOG_09043 [Capsaspora owczarzaki ATCC 30864]|uniref:hypothetical protein n=1 Tax=Capsaspora owczarzaki (strain ATCC 30864) TaxID=595528 RepID=UPI0003526313|nr:hypothetical protein CAOG_09043 [Capsaspora owczarzaki ATCC 30864]|eukprot:XP_011270731.1 hypothetical protein CAOG_09043 [Capsaspora owczarzaki ATCC 30864]